MPDSGVIELRVEYRIRPFGNHPLFKEALEDFLRDCYKLVVNNERVAVLMLDYYFMRTVFRRYRELLRKLESNVNTMRAAIYDYENNNRYLREVNEDG